MLQAAELAFRRSQWGAIPVRELLINGSTIQEIFAKFTDEHSAMLSTCISPLGLLEAANAEVSLARFLPEGPADFPNGHRAILVCRECGDFGCGALTVRIAAEGDNVVWSDWLWQVDYDYSTRGNFDGQVPGFTFRAEQYLATLRAALA
jgi:hypothetical protein